MWWIYGKIGIFYGSTTGNTRTVAEQIHTEFGEETADLVNIVKSKAANLSAYQNLVLGASTWCTGDMQDDWVNTVEDLKQVDLFGKKVALFGTGDPMRFYETFVDAIGILYEAVEEAGAEVVGFTPASEFDFGGSRAQMGEKLVGLAIDQDNEESLTDEKVKKWVDELNKQFS